MDASRLNSCSSRSAAKEEKSDESVDRKEGCTQSQSSKEDELEIAKAKMREVREENARLKMMLEQIENDYKSLQKRFVESLQVEAKNASNAACSTVEDMTEEPDEFVSLRLGSSPSEPKKDDNNSSCGKISTGDDEQLKGGLKLGLDFHLGGSKSDPLVEVSPDNSSEVERKNEDAGEAWPPSKVLKKMRSEEDESSQQPSPKRARVSVRARCDTPTMNDGCQWRKYGQKIAKGNPCPRAYYRCTVAPACPVRKQVQRCAEDMSILITTYEGTHNHPLTSLATAMASTTSAAASMLLSGSSTSQPGLGLTATTTQSTNLHGLKVNFPDISRTGPFYLPNSSPPTFPTITLDLTTSNPAHYNMFSSSSFPSKNFNFSSSETNISPSVWGNGYLNNYSKLPYDKPLVGSSTLGRPAQEHFYQPFMEKNNQAASSQQPLTESLTKALTSDPSFQSVIAAAISSMVGGGGSGSQGGGERFGQNLKWGEAGCASSYLTKSPSSNSQTGSMNALQQPTSSPFSVSKSNSATAKNGDQTK